MHIPFFRPKLVKSRVFQLGLITAVYWISFGLVETVWAIYLESVLGSASAAGVAVGVLTVVGVVAAFLAPRIMSRAKDTLVYSISLVGIGLSYLVFAFTESLLLFLVVAMFFSIFKAARAASMGIIFRDESGDRDIDQNEGLVFTMSNMGYLLGPLIAGYFSATMGVQSVFALAAVFVAITLLRFRQISIKDIEHHTRDKPVLRNLVAILRDPTLLKAYVANGGINVWWGLAYVYIPLMVVGRGYDIGWIGLMLFAMSLPLILVEYPAMKRIRRIGHHNYFLVGYGLLALVSLAMFAFNSVEQLVVLFAVAGFGCALLEPTGVAYFFGIVGKEEEENLYAPFLTSKAIIFAVSIFLYAAVIEVVSFNAIFVAGAVLLVALAGLGASLRRIGGKGIKIRK